MTWYATCDSFIKNPNDLDVWTLSENPDETGWITDDGHGCGLPRAKAEYLATVANAAENWNNLQYRKAPGPRKQIEPMVTNCAVCKKQYTVTWENYSAIRCDECATADPPAEIDEAEAQKIRELIALHWKVIETPPMSDIQCIEFAKLIVDNILQGPSANQYDAIRLLHWVNVGVVNGMNIVHGGRGVLAQMLMDAIRDGVKHFPEEDKEGDTHGAATVYNAA